MLFDDGTTSRLAPEHFLITTTTANAARGAGAHGVPAAGALPAAATCSLSDVTDQWAQFAVAGPRARDVLAAALPRGGPVQRRPSPSWRPPHVTLAGHHRDDCSASPSPANSPTSSPCRRAHALTRLDALLQAGEPFGIRPYGLDALNTLRIEKGHVTDGGAQRQHQRRRPRLRAHAEEAGRLHRSRARRARPGMLAGERLQLVGVRPVDRSAAPAQRHAAREPPPPGVSLGYVTSCTPSTELEGWVGLALLAGGRAAHRRRSLNGAVARARRAHRARIRQSAHARSGERPCPRLTRHLRTHPAAASPWPCGRRISWSSTHLRRRERGCPAPRSGAARSACSAGAASAPRRAGPERATRPLAADVPHAPARAARGRRRWTRACAGQGAVVELSSALASFLLAGPRHARSTQPRLPAATWTPRGIPDRARRRHDHGAGVGDPRRSCRAGMLLLTPASTAQHSASGLPPAPRRSGWPCGRQDFIERASVQRGSPLL